MKIVVAVVSVAALAACTRVVEVAPSTSPQVAPDGAHPVAEYLLDNYDLMIATARTLDRYTDALDVYDVDRAAMLSLEISDLYDQMLDGAPEPVSAVDRDLVDAMSLCADAYDNIAYALGAGSVGLLQQAAQEADDCSDAWQDAAEELQFLAEGA